MIQIQNSGRRRPTEVGVLVCKAHLVAGAFSTTIMEMDDPSGPSGLLIGAFVGLVGLSGLFSGLTLGLMGLDLVSLQIIVDSGGNNEAKWAKSILPLRERGNWLLCTLLLGNVLVNVALTQVSGKS